MGCAGRRINILLLSGLIAAAAAYFFNSWAIKKWGKIVIFTVSPILEEFLKTGLAIFMGGQIFFTHLTFGLAEAVLDVIRPGKRDLPAGLTGLVSHGVFGWLTQYLWQVTGNIWLAITAAIAAHGLWNAGTVFLIPRK